MGTQTDQVSVVTGGFEEPIHDAQRVFHAVMQALARPGTVHSIEPCADAPTPIYPATAALLQMLADADSPVWLDHAANTATVTGC
ncbi:MAG: phosphonate C-P lyase system protein PhnH [Pseudomonadota bacterium]